MQRKIGPLSIWIATVLQQAAYPFHILALDLERDLPGFSIAREERQLNGETLFSFYFFLAQQSPEEFDEDQHDHYEPPNTQGSVSVTNADTAPTSSPLFSTNQFSS